jgi:hypothetical protein
LRKRITVEKGMDFTSDGGGTVMVTGAPSSLTLTTAVRPDDLVGSAPLTVRVP